MNGNGPMVLIVDDDAAVGRVLRDTVAARYHALAVTSPLRALDIVRDQDVAIVMADQRMPEMNGLELLAEVRKLRPTAVGVLTTGHAELDSAIRAINSVRIMGFLTKPWDERELEEVLQRAMDAHLALRALARAPQQHELELRRFEHLSEAAPVPITAQRFGVLPLRDSFPQDFNRLVGAYGDILAHAMEQRSFKVDHNLSDALHDLANRLGALSAGPRDVIDLHVAALRAQLSHASLEQQAALAEEGRLLVLELMGHVVTYYRSFTLGLRT